MEIEQVYRVAYDAFTHALDQKLTTPETDVSIAPKFYHGTMVLKPRDPSMQSKEVDLEVFFKRSSRFAIICAFWSRRSTAAPLKKRKKLSYKVTSPVAMAA